MHPLSPSDAESIRARFGERVRERRRALGLSQEKLAERAGLHRTYIGSVERGDCNLTLVNVVRVARGLGVGADELTRDL